MPPKKGAKGYKRRGRKVSNAVKQYVDRAISRNTETKRITYDAGVQNFNNSITASGDINFLLPTINQGTYSYNRIGTKIKIKKMVVRGHICWDGTSTSGMQKIGARMMVIKSKKVPNGDAGSVAGQLPYLLEAGGGSYQSFNGEVGDLHSPVNKKAWAVARDRKMYMYQQGSNADDLSRAVKFFTLDIKQARGKIINYEFESGTPTNWGWYLTFGWVCLDGTIVATTNYNLTTEYVVDVEFEDA